MLLDLDAVLSSELGLAVARGVSRLTPPVLGLRLAEGAADVIASRRDVDIVRAVRANRWVVSGGDLRGGGLDAAVRSSFRMMGTFVYDLYRLAGDEEALAASVTPTPATEEVLARSAAGEPMVLCTVHTGNFDLAGRALALRGLRMQVLSVPSPTDAYRAQNEMRRQAGLEITPVSIASLRAAHERLTAGGTVLTGVDRPLGRAGAVLPFFGSPARLPDVHVRLAARAGAALVLTWCEACGEGRYTVDSVPVAGQSSPSSAGADALAVLRAAEGVISTVPSQWAMPHAVWPEAAAELDAIEAAEGSATSLR